MLFEKLKEECITSTLLYIGYSNRDTNWQELLHENSGRVLPFALALIVSSSYGDFDIDKELLKAKRIVTIDATLDEFSERSSSPRSGTNRCR